MTLQDYSDQQLLDEIKQRREREVKASRYTAEHSSPKSARDVMPTIEAEMRAALYPCPGDRWQEMFSTWAHVDQVTATHVVVRLYIGPCTIRPEEARETWEVPLTEYPQRMLRNFHYLDNQYWVAVSGERYLDDENTPFPRSTRAEKSVKVSNREAIDLCSTL